MTNQIQPSNSSSTINPNDDEVCRLDQGDVSNDRTRYTELAKKKKKLESQLAERMAIEMNNQSSPLLAFNLQNQLSAFMGHDQMDDVPGGGEFVTLSDLKSVIAAFVKTDGNGSSQQEDAMPAQLNQAGRRVHATSSPSPGTGAMDALPGRSSSSSSPSPSPSSSPSPSPSSSQSGHIAEGSVAPLASSMISGADPQAPDTLSTASTPANQVQGGAERLGLPQGQSAVRQVHGSARSDKLAIPGKRSIAEESDRMAGVKRSIDPGQGVSYQSERPTKATAPVRHQTDKADEKENDPELAQNVQVAVNQTSDVLFVPAQTSAFAETASHQANKKMMAKLEKQSGVGTDKKEGVTFKHNFASWGEGKSVDIIGSAAAGYTAVASDDETADILKRYADESMNVDLKIASDDRFQAPLSPVTPDDEKHKK